MDEPHRTESADCHICGQKLRIANVLPKLGQHKELVTFKCDNCGDLFTIRVNGDSHGEDYRVLTSREPRGVVYARDCPIFEKELPPPHLCWHGSNEQVNVHVR